VEGGPWELDPSKVEPSKVDPKTMELIGVCEGGADELERIGTQPRIGRIFSKITE
jgi:hypothetical protein